MRIEEQPRTAALSLPKPFIYVVDYLELPFNLLFLRTNLPTIPKRPILLISKIGIRRPILIQLLPLPVPYYRTLQPTTTNISGFPFSPLIIPHTKQPINHRGENKQPPCNQRRDQALQVLGPIRPQLRRRNAPGAVADEEHGVDDRAFRVAFYV